MTMFCPADGRRRVAFAAFFLLAMICAGPGRAEHGSGAPATGFVAPQLAQSASGPRADLAASQGGVIRHLANNVQGFRLAGEIASSEWPLYLTAGQARDQLRFQIGYLSAVSVMPEASFLAVAINDVTIGATHIRASTGVRTAIFDVPAGVLKPGFNSVRISAQERHRVDCSVQATYELWTQIDPTATGLILPTEDPGVTNLGDLPALAPDAEGALPIRAVLPSPATSRDVDRLVRAVELISLVGRFEQPLVDIGPMAGGGYGINLVIGTAADLARAAVAPSLFDVSGPRVLVIASHAGLRPTIVVTGVTESDVDEALEQIVAAREVVGTPSGLRAAQAFPGFRVQGGAQVVLRALGVHSEEFGGRLFRTGFNLMMPPDFYAADYGKVFLDLAGGYAAGLAPGAEVLVKVNDRDATSLRLTNSNGDLFRNESIPLPLGYLRPGFNRVEIEAHLPTSEDRVCDPLATLSGAKRFLFLDSTKIEIPPIARIARMPDLAVTATGGFPYARADRRPKLWLPLPDRQSVAAAASVAAHLALAAGAPLNFEFTAQEPAPDDGPVLAVGPASSLDRSLFSAAGLDPADVDAAWRNLSNAGAPPGSIGQSRYDAQADHRVALEQNSPAACHLGVFENGLSASVAESSVKAAIPLPATTSDSGLAREWEVRINGESPWRKWLTDLPGAVHDLFDASADRVAGLLDDQALVTHRDPILGSESSLVVGQDLLGDDTGGLWTFVTAPNSTVLFDATGCLVDPRVWQQLSGRLSVLDASKGVVTTQAALDPKLIVTQPLSLQNMRLIAASWLSLNSGVYVLSALVAASLLAASTTWFIRNVGRRNS